MNEIHHPTTRIFYL